MHQNCRGRIAEALMEDGRPRPSSQQLLINCHFERSEKSAFYMGTADFSPPEGVRNDNIRGLG